MFCLWECSVWTCLFLSYSCYCHCYCPRQVLSTAQHGFLKCLPHWLGILHSKPSSASSFFEFVKDLGSEISPLCSTTFNYLKNSFLAPWIVFHETSCFDQNLSFQPHFLLLCHISLSLVVTELSILGNFCHKKTWWKKYKKKPPQKKKPKTNKDMKVLPRQINTIFHLP